MKKPKAATGHRESGPGDPGRGETAHREFGRRAFLRSLGAGAAVVAASEGLADAAHADSWNYQDKSKARYQPDSKNVQNFYRVNRYPPKRG
jgi:hypothetical protein